jgi:hypothetical protein
MPAAVVKLPRTRHVRRPHPVIKEVKHALEQLEIQSSYPGRPPFTDVLPQSEYSPWPRVDDDE